MVPELNRCQVLHGPDADAGHRAATPPAKRSKSFDLAEGGGGGGGGEALAGVEIGGAVTLTRACDFLHGVIREHPPHATQGLQAIVTMCQWFASNQVGRWVPRTVPALLEFYCCSY
jgi:hypothetical protein